MQIDGLFAGKPAPFGPRKAPSSIIKTAVPFLTVTSDGTEEDEQGNKKLHGGPEKVLHQYGLPGYRQLSKAYPSLSGSFVPGSIGENITVDGMDDTRVQVGDIYKMGDVVLQVSAPRAPCNKISHRFGEKNMDRYVGKHGITGWYYRVLETGVLTLNAEVTLIERPVESVSIHDLVTAVFAEEAKHEDLCYYSTLEALDQEWREKCKHKAMRAER
ncbi:MOSC domain-containing protein [Alteromonas sediminis]|uniref:MOSC domain-containing protein n=1 Tax=Alteromonas sediminis TaxID=2259342 RepID=A0A3N5XXQ4_9ALTE|nr:MOSC domain-containing protein [Alteromonas sediminis]RPJ65270.1 MOSC domain-containing protein [Alteromonas sediminis]